jgi:hypothetical protein
MTEEYAIGLIKECNSINNCDAVKNVIEKIGRLGLSISSVINYIVPTEYINAPEGVLTRYGYNAFHAACETPNSDVIKLLIENGANVNLQNKNGDTPLMIVDSQISAMESDKYPSPADSQHLLTFRKMRQYIKAKSGGRRKYKKSRKGGRKFKQRRRTNKRNK